MPTKMSQPCVSQLAEQQTQVTSQYDLSHTRQNYVLCGSMCVSPQYLYAGKVKHCFLIQF